MLPIDELDQSSLDYLRKHGVDSSHIDMAAHVDLSNEAKYHNSLLAFNSHEKEMYLFSPGDDTFTTYDLNIYTDLSIDNFIGSVRVIAQKVCEDGKKIAVPICTATGNCRPQLIVFTDLSSRLLKGDVISNDDDVFKQFAKKCPKCHLKYKKGTTICPRCDKDSRMFLRAIRYFRPFFGGSLFVLFCMMCCAAVALVTPQIQGKFLYDQVINPNGSYHGEGYVWLAIGMIFGIAVFSLIIQIAQQTTQDNVSDMVIARMKKDVFAKMQSLSLSYFGSNPTGRLIHRVNEDATQIARFVQFQIPAFIYNTFTFVGMIILLYFMNWKLTSLIFIPVPLVFIIFKVMLPKINRMYRRTWRTNATLSGIIGDSLTGARVVKAFAKETDEANRFRKVSERLAQLHIDSNLVWITIFPVVGLLIGIASQTIWGVGGVMVMHEEMSYGEFVTYFGYVGMAFSPLSFYSSFSDSVTSVINNSMHYFETMDSVPDIIEKTNAVNPGHIEGSIEFDRVNFSYEPNRPILRDVSFRIEAGEHIGIVGHTGSGKSTIANLITRMYDPQSGRILIDGNEMKDLDISLVRRSIAIISQEIYIFRGTIADNIRYAKPDATIEEVIAVSRAANAHDFIMKLPQGYNTMVGIGSRALSGGEQQRISIARALLISPSILILDEATAAMDTETERLIGKAINNIVKGRTTISIAHRLSTLKNCGRLYAIENGEIAESGTHEELIAARGIYYKLYSLQSEADRKIAIGE